jgi:hypothetical protein
VSSTLDRVDCNAELVRGDLEKAVQQPKRESGKGLFMGGVKLPLALAELDWSMLRDADKIFGDDFRRQLKDMTIQEVLSIPRSPWQRA